MADMRIDDFFTEFANAMRVGSPGRCFERTDRRCDVCGGGGAVAVGSYGPDPQPPEPCDRCDGFGVEFDTYSWHVLNGDHVRKVKEQSAAGGIVYCERCDRAIFVPGKPGAGIEVRNFPGEINLKGVSL